MLKIKNKTRQLTGIAATALVAFYIFMPFSAHAFCVTESDGVTCGSSCSTGDECGLVEGSAIGRCEATVNPATETSGIFCFDDAELVEATAAEQAAGEAADAAIDARIRSEQAIPILAINIPGVSFATIRKTTVEDGLYDVYEIPWLADYTVGVYRYSVFFGSILAIVMIMIGGLQWLTAGGDASRISNARNRINSAVVGLVLLLGTFLVLNTINPDLTTLKPLTIKQVSELRYDAKTELQTTTVSTEAPDEVTE